VTHPDIIEKNLNVEADFGLFYTASEDVPPPQKRMRKTHIRPLNNSLRNKHER
jgi:hypothetical protein